MSDAENTDYTSGSDLVHGYLPLVISRDGMITEYLSAIGESITEFTKIRERKVRNQHWIDTVEGYSLDRIGLSLSNVKRFDDNDVKYKYRIKSVMSFDGGGNLNTLTGMAQMEYNTGSWFAWNTMNQLCNEGIECNRFGRCFGESGRSTLIEWIYPSGQSFGSTAERFNFNVLQFKALGVMYNGFGETLPSNLDGGMLTGGWYCYDPQGKQISMTVVTSNTGDSYIYGGSSIHTNFDSVSYADTGEFYITKSWDSPFNILESGHTTFNFWMVGDNADLKLTRVELYSSASIEKRSYKRLDLIESNGLDRTDEIVTVSVNGLATNECYYDSPRLYQPDIDGTEITSQVHNAYNDAWDRFKTDTDWTTDLTNWTETIGAGGTLRLLPNYMGYKSVVQLIRSGNDVSMYANQTPGDKGIAVLVRPAQTNGILEIKTFEDTGASGNVAIYIKINSDGNIVYVDSGGSNQTVQSYSADEWYYIEARNINHSADTYDIYVNGTLKITGATFRNAITDSDSFELDVTTDGTFYVAAVDGGWDANWYEGRILYLTDFDISFLATVSASTTKTYRIYYYSYSMGSTSYTGISRSTNVVTCSDGTQYTLSASTDSQFCTDGVDKNSLDWAKASPWFMSDPDIGSAVAPLWLEDGVVFNSVVYHNSATEEYLLTIFDNNIVERRMVYSSDWMWSNISSNAGGSNVDNLGYYKSGWQYVAQAGAPTNVYDTMTSGRLYWEDTDKSVLYVQVWDMTQDTDADKIRIFTDVGDFEDHIGWTLGGFQLSAGNKITAYSGLRDCGSTSRATKETYVDNLYTEIISSPLTQSLTDEVDEIIINGNIGYTTDESGTDLTGITFPVGNFYNYRLNLYNYNKSYTGEGFNSNSVSGVTFVFYGASGDTISIYWDAIHFGKRYSQTGYPM